MLLPDPGEGEFNDLAFSRSERVAVPAVSAEIDERSRKNHAQILRVLAEVKQTELARTINLSDSTITRWENPREGGASGLETPARVLAVLGFKVVPIKAKCFMELKE